MTLHINTGNLNTGTPACAVLSLTNWCPPQKSNKTKLICINIAALIPVVQRMRSDVFYAFGRLAGNGTQYTIYIINAYYGIKYKGCNADMFSEGN